jgi:hypothetical protein
VPSVYIRKVQYCLVVWDVGAERAVLSKFNSHRMGEKRDI